MTSQADAVEALTALLRSDLAGVGDRIDAEQQALLQSWPSLGRLARLRALRALKRRIGDLTAAAQEIARLSTAGAIQQAYRLGAAGMAIAINRSPVFGGTDTQAVAALAADTYGDLLEATRGVTQSTKELVRVLAREHVLDKLLTGQTPAQASQKLAQDLDAHRITAIVYKDGSRHGLTEYSDLVIRTKTAEAHQVGGFTQARVVGIDYVELQDGPGCGLSSHQDPRKANGLILPVDEAALYPLAHPRCRRVSSPRPDVGVHNVATAQPIGPQFSAEDIAREHANGGSGASKALARNQTLRTKRSGGLAGERGQSAAQRRNAARIARRVSSTS